MKGQLMIWLVSEDDNYLSSPRLLPELTLNDLLNESIFRYILEK
jgi:hypothetical protein